MKVFEKGFTSFNLSMSINDCMNQNIFQFDEKWHKQTVGTALMNPLSWLVRIRKRFHGEFWDESTSITTLFS